MAKYRKRPVIIKAVRLKERVVIKTLKGDMIGNPGDWLITGVQDEKYPCKHEIFIETYEPDADSEDYDPFFLDFDEFMEMEEIRKEALERKRQWKQR